MSKRTQGCIGLNDVITNDPSSPTMADAEHLVACWNAIEDQYGGDPAKVEQMAKALMPERDRLSVEEANSWLRSENERLLTALNHIAAWDKGPEVTSSFDEPGSAKIAREALKP